MWIIFGKLKLMHVLLQMSWVKVHNKFTHSELCASCLPYYCGLWRCCRHSNWLWIVKLVHSIGAESWKVWSKVYSLKPLLFRRFKRARSVNMEDSPMSWAICGWSFLLRVGECLLSELEQASGAIVGGNGPKSGSRRRAEKGVWGRSSEDLGHLCMPKKLWIVTQGSHLTPAGGLALSGTRTVQQEWEDWWRLRLESQPLLLWSLSSSWVLSSSCGYIAFSLSYNGSPRVTISYREAPLTLQAMTFIMV